jgi:hypothetical protein
MNSPEIKVKAANRNNLHLKAELEGKEVGEIQLGMHNFPIIGTIKFTGLIRTNGGEEGIPRALLMAAKEHLVQIAKLNKQKIEHVIRVDFDAKKGIDLRALALELGYKRGSPWKNSNGEKIETYRMTFTPK